MSFFLLFEGRGCLECHRLGSGDLHRSASLGIVACASWTGFGFKRPETDDLDLFGLDGGRDGRKNCVEGCSSALAGCTFTEILLDGIDELSFVHRPLS